jgi:outer membrane murein-binding lipoprotein Lpp
MVRFGPFVCYLLAGSQKLFRFSRAISISGAELSKKNRNIWRTSRPTTQETSAAQLAANRANAQLSPGPTTPAGKAKSCLNAVKTGLTGRTVLLPNDDVAEYEEHMHRYQAEFAPVGQREIDLVQSIAETAWRLKRIPSLEAGIYAIGYRELAESFEEDDAELRPSLIQVAVHLKYERQIRNLQLQESRLVRRREKEIAELRQLQKERKAAEQESQAAPAQVTRPNEFAENGFEFSPSPEVAAAFKELAGPYDFSKRSKAA